MGRADRDAVWQSLNIAFYALVQQLEDAGVIDPEKLADEIERYDPGGKAVLRANLNGITMTLRNRPFSDKPRMLAVIEGGKGGGDGAG